MAKFDRTGKRARWTRAQAAESHYNTTLRGVARQIGVLSRGLAPGGSLERASDLIRALTAYSEVIKPWAYSVAEYMVADVARRDKAMWKQNSKDLGHELRRQLENAPVGQVLRSLQAEQVRLIQSIPLDAAQRVQHLANLSITHGTRAKEIAQEVMRTEEVSKSKATLIARTEISKAQSNLVEARSLSVGSEGYIWRTARDGDVRESHAAMEGKYVRWSSPPTLDGMTGHAGCFPNCRCYAEPVLPDE